MAQAAQQELTPGSRESAKALVPEVAGKGIYTDLPSLLGAFDKLRDRFNLCFPITKPDIIPPLHAVAVREIAIDARVDGSGKPIGADLYRDKGQYRLTKVALDKIAAAGGISWHPAYTGRVDDESDPNYCRFRACAVVMGLDGRERMETDHKGIDLRDGAAHGMTPDQLKEARKHLEQLAESKAKNRCIRRFAFIKGGYTLDEVRRPFVITALVFTGETSDPELKREVVRAMVQRATGATSALFGPAPTPQLLDDPGRRTPPPALESDHDDDSDDGTGAGADPDPAAPRRFIAKVTDVSSQSSPPDSRRRWTLHTVTFDDGTKATTFDRKSAGIASDAYEHDHPVAVETKQGDFGLEIATIAFVNAEGGES